MSWNISYAHFIPLEVMFHLSPFSFTRGRAKAKCGVLLTVAKYQNLGRQLLHKHMKCKHQNSGRGLLLIIFTSVGKYLYAGELKEKHTSRARKHTPQSKAKDVDQSERAIQPHMDSWAHMQQETDIPKA